MLKMLAGTEKKKKVTSLAFHGLEESITLPILNCAVGLRGGKENLLVNYREQFSPFGGLISCLPSVTMLIYACQVNLYSFV